MAGVWWGERAERDWLRRRKLALAIMKTPQSEPLHSCVQGCELEAKLWMLMRWRGYFKDISSKYLRREGRGLEDPEDVRLSYQ